MSKSKARRTRRAINRSKRPLFAAGLRHPTFQRGLRFESLEDRRLLAGDVTTGLVGHWQLDESLIGQSVVDVSPSGNDGTHFNIASPDGPNANAAVGSHSLSTDGVNDFVSIPSSSSLDLSGGQFTQSVWILPEHVDNNFHGVLGFHDDGFTKRYPGIWIKQQDKIHAGFGDGTEYHSFSTGSVLTPFAWNHVVTTFDGNEYKVFVDGSEAFSTLGLSGKVPFPTQQLNIGRIDNNFNGLIDDVRIYNRALTEEDVTLLFTGTTSDVDPPVADVVNVAHATTIDFTVLLTDNAAIDTSTLDSSDLRVTGPFGFDQPASFVSIDNNTDGSPRTAIYSIAAPAINGTYSVNLAANQVSDTSGNFVAAGQLVTFNINDSSSEPDPTGLVGHWRLDETAIGQTVLDASGFGNEGNHFNVSSPDGPNIDAAVGSHSFSTDGVDDYIHVPDDASLDLSGGQFTQSVWIHPDHIDNDFHGVIGSQENGYAKRYPGIWIKQQDKIHAGFGDGTDYHSFSTGSVLTPSEWNHVVTTFDGNAYKLYVDGAEVFSTLSLSGKVPFPTQSVDIGRINNYFDGLLDDVRIYRRALGPTEVNQLFDLRGANPATLAVTIAADSIGEGSGPGATIATVTRSSDTSSELIVNLSSSDSGEATVPISITIPAGQSTSAPFSIDAVDDAIVDGTQTVTVTASAAAHTDGTDTVDVTDNEIAGLTVTIVDAAISENGERPRPR